MPKKIEYTVLELIESTARNIRAVPLNLGGVSGSDGGIGGPPGGFIGLLPQYQVAYDTTEAATLATVGSGTLVDNLNHIRYRLNTLEAGSGVLLVEEYDGSPSVNNVDKIIFSGATVINLGNGDVLVAISGGGGGGSPLTVEDADESVSNVATIVFPDAEITNNGGGEVQVEFLYDPNRVLLTNGLGKVVTQPWLEWNSSEEVIEFGADVAGKETNAGKIGYEAFGAGFLHIVGAGTTAGSRKVKIYDDLDVDNSLTVGGVGIDFAKLVTNGDSHDHSGGDGAQINHTTLSNIGTNTHAQIDSFMSDHSSQHEFLGSDEIAIRDIFMARVHPAVFKDWSNLDGFTASHTGTGAFAAGWFTADPTTGATNGSRCCISSNTTVDMVSSAALLARFKTRINPRTVTTNLTMWLGYLTNPTAPTATEHHAAFKIAEGTIYASSGDGTTGNLVSTGVTVGQFAVADLMIKETTSSVEYYVNGTLTNTFTSNRPNVFNTLKLTFFLQNSTGAARTIRVFPYWHMQGT